MLEGAVDGQRVHVRKVANLAAIANHFRAGSETGTPMAPPFPHHFTITKLALEIFEGLGINGAVPQNLGMASIDDKATQPAELGWLAEVQEFAPPLGADSPIWMREVQVNFGTGIVSGERHPCCEVGLVLEGQGTGFIEGEHAQFAPGDLLLIGPGVPHSTRIDRCPHRALSAFFLPAILLEMGPLGDGAVLLRRLTMRQDIRHRLLRLPSKYQRKFETGLRRMWRDFHTRPLGWEMRLRACLAELLVAVVRWEQEQGGLSPNEELGDDWAKLENALAYIRRHFAEPIYATDLARATAMSETRLKNLFDQTLGIPWTTFLQGYRVRQAAAQLCLPSQSVTEVALSAGFESMSHFTRVFRKFTGTAPSSYAKRQSL